MQEKKSLNIMSFSRKKNICVFYDTIIVKVYGFAYISITSNEQIK